MSGFSTSRGSQSGVALLAVLVALSVLLALVGPFVLSMGRGDAAARSAVDEVRAEWAAASARDAVLQAAAESAYGRDLDPASDGRAEYPDRLELEGELASLGDSGFGQTLLQAEVQDAQRFVQLDTATPLLLGNLLGLAARSTDELELDANELPVDDSVENFPESGFLLIGREVVSYRSREGNKFRGLQRGLMAEMGFLPATLLSDYIVPADELVLDLRCVMAVLYPHLANGDSGTRQPYADVGEVQRMLNIGPTSFDAVELARLRRDCTTVGLRENAARWGRAERVFQIRNDGLTGLPRLLQVRSGAGLGAGRIVRIRSLHDERQEYALVANTATSGNSGAINLPNFVTLSLMLPLATTFDDVDTVVEPLVPVPININTADEHIVSAVLAHLRPNIPGVVRDGVTQNRPPFVSRRKADELARAIVALRGDLDLEFAADVLSEQRDESAGADFSVRPFAGWEDFAQRFVPLVYSGGSASQQQRNLALRVYEGLQIGSSNRIQRATAPISFHSSPLVRYRASAARLRASGQEVARCELQGEALALPGSRMIWAGQTQELIEEYWRLDRENPWWLSGPINTSAVLPNRRGTVPALRTEAHLLADVFPGFGFGRRRFPDKDGDDGYFRPLPASTPWSFPNTDADLYAHESFLSAQNPEGRDLSQDGAYRIQNVGPRSGAIGAGAARTRNRRHDQISFPLTIDQGLTARHAVSFWFRPRNTGQQMLFDLASSNDDAGPDRNRIRLEIRDQTLLLEVLPEAGLDPDPSLSLAAPEFTSGRWEIPLADVQLQAETWYHVNFSALGDRPGQLSLMLDGVPRGQARYRTTLVNAIGPYLPAQGQPNLTDDNDRFLRIPVENAEDFPQAGILRIGRELFEYSSRDDGNFYCAFDNSIGGRQARSWTYEYSIRVPNPDSRDQQQEYRELVNQLTDPQPVPDHPIGSAVELYGYSLPVYPASTLTPGGATLVDALGPFAVARIINTDTTAITVTAGQQAFPVGDGIDETWNGDIELGDPISADPSGNLPPADNKIIDAFPQSGGYALIMQKPFLFQPNASTITGGNVPVGGIELITYASRNGTKLSGVQRAVAAPTALPGAGPNDPHFQHDRAHRFVMRWNPNLTAQNAPAGGGAGGGGGGRGISFNELPVTYPYVVPISINVAGSLNDVTDYVQWLQIRANGTDDAETEWVRYNAVDGNRVVRAERRAWLNGMERLVGTAPVTILVRFQGNLQPTPDNPAFNPETYRDDLSPTPWPTPLVDATRRIGYIENPSDPLIIPGEVLRRALRFRGDDFRDIVGSNQGRTQPYCETASHTHAAGTQVLPVHRFEFSRGAFGLSAPRPGRLDRIAMVQGSQRAGGQAPGVQWQTINWSVPVARSDNIGDLVTDGLTGGGQLWGPFPFYLVAFQDVVRLPLVGSGQPSYDGQNDVVFDPRLVDRIVKFPSGELPAIDTDEAFVGGSALGDGVDSGALLDEVRVVARMANERVLDQQLPEDATEFFVLPGSLVTPVGIVGPATLQPSRRYGGFEQFPQTGGLLMIDDEILAFETYAPGTGRVQIAADGRGLLGTTARAHDEGAIVQFLEHVPAAILASGLNENDDQIQTNGLGFLPRHGGTLLVGGGGGRGGLSEVLHYTWSLGDQTLAMPRWKPAEEGRAEAGLLRGRYGTAPISVSSGAPVIWLPQRYWDRHRELAVDPELSHAQVTLDHGPVWFGGLGWKDETPDATVDIHCLVRVDESAPWDSDPDSTIGLFRFDEGQPNDATNPLRMFGRRIELRFQQIYLPGAFDPIQFLGQGWKRAANIRWFLVDYEAETRILDEKVSAR